MTPLIFLDTETTGLKPDVHAPWEIAWVTAMHDDTTLTLHQSRSRSIRLTPEQLTDADPAALMIGRFVERYSGPESWASWEVLNLLQQDIANITTEVPHLVGAVPSFDHNMLCVNWLGWPGFGEGLWHYHIIDVEILAAGKLGIPPPYTSSDLTARLGIVVDEDTKHTAAGDVEWAVRMYAACYGLEIVRPNDMLGTDDRKVHP